MSHLLSINNLYTCFKTSSNIITPAVNGISICVEKGTTVALVGESGSGKSIAALSIMRLLPPPGFIQSGEIIFKGTDLLRLSEEAMRSIRGSRISMVFQEPMTSLNPVLRICDQIIEPLILHTKMSRTKAMEMGVELLHRVGIPSANDRMQDYPHQLSGGMRQRVVIAMALACNPALLIADEPTTALDVTIQAQIMELINTLRQSTEMGILLITHDLGIVAERSDHTYIIYAGYIVESAPSSQLFNNPFHPYTKSLLAALPQNAEPGSHLTTLSTTMPDKGTNLSGCVFFNSCPVALQECRNLNPTLSELKPGHFVRCWNGQ